MCRLNLLKFPLSKSKETAMPFVYKQFTEADQPKYDSCNIKNYLRTFTYPYEWVVDEEIDAWFVPLGGRGSQPESHGEPPSFFVLVWKSQPIYFEGRYDLVKTGLWKYTLDLFIPLALKSSEQIIKEMIHKAISAYESHYSSHLTEVMPINFSTFFVAGQ